MRGRLRPLAPLVLAASLLGCSAPTEIDGWRLGPLLERCADQLGQLPCGAWLGTAFAMRGDGAPAGWTVDAYLADVPESLMRANATLVVVVATGPLPWERWAVGMACPIAADRCEPMPPSGPP